MLIYKMSLTASERLRFTRTYTFESNCGTTGNGINNDMGDFDILIRSDPFPQNIKSSRAIFTLQSFYIGLQTEFLHD